MLEVFGVVLNGIFSLMAFLFILCISMKNFLNKRYRIITYRTDTHKYPGLNSIDQWLQGMPYSVVMGWPYCSLALPLLYPSIVCIGRSLFRFRGMSLLNEQDARCGNYFLHTARCGKQGEVIFPPCWYIFHKCSVSLLSAFKR